MDPQELALLETIRANPCDDGPRLVYADWLEERGACDRAEFIRVQLDRDALDACDPRQAALARRERELTERHTPEWVDMPFRLFAHYAPPPDEPYFEPLDPVTTRELTPSPRWCFRRGFVWAEVSAGQFLAHAGMLRDAAPLVQIHVGPDSYKEVVQRFRDPGSLRPRRDLFRDLLASPLLPAAGLGLTLVEESDWEQLFLLGRTQRLAALHSRGASAYVWHLRELARAPGLARLTELSLNQMELADPAARELAACPCLPNLRLLDLRSNHVGPDGVVALTAALPGSRLRTLDLSDNPIGDAGAQSLARWPGLAGVRVLRLGGCGIGPRGAAALGASPYLGSLTQLSLQRNQIRGAGVKALLNHRGLAWLGRLARLDLCGNKVGVIGAQHLTTSAPFLGSLRRLYLSGDRDDLDDLHRRWLEEAFDGRLHVDWFESPGQP